MGRFNLSRWAVEHRPLVLLARQVQVIASIRDRIQRSCAGGGTAEDQVKRLDFSDLKLQISPLFARGMDGMCQELKN